MTNDNTANQHYRNYEHDTRRLRLRFERDNSTERYPCQEYTVEVTTDEINVMVETDYQQRLTAADDPNLVERRDPNMILELEVGRVEYNNAKSHHRNTLFRASNPRDEAERVSVIETGLSTDGYLAENDTLADPADVWVGELNIWDAINSLTERECAVLVAVKIQGYTQSEVAKFLGVSQPMVNRILKRAIARLEAQLS
ncbi:sigma factor-like helix-turn-helix DNA-binding protein [Dermabacteraceae bacterium P13138]